MIVADTYVGNLADPEVAERVDEADAVRIEVDDTRRRRSRFRATAEDGRDVGVVSGRVLSDGDVLAGAEVLVVVRLESVEALVLDFADAEVTATTGLEVGHAIGNRHWDLAVRGDEVVLPLVEDRERMDAAIRPLRAAGVAVRVEAVPAATFDDGNGGSARSHGHSHSHPDLPPRVRSEARSKDEGHAHSPSDHHDVAGAHDTD